MKHNLLTRDALVICGPTIRTSFQSAASEIPAFWNRIHTERCLDRVAHASRPGLIIAAYHHYESDFRGAYSMTIGTPVSSRDTNAFDCLELPGGNYGVFEPSGDLGLAVYQCWSHIWSEWPRRSDRLYSADFEIYEPVPVRNDPPRVSIWVGLRS